MFVFNAALKIGATAGMIIGLIMMLVGVFAVADGDNAKFKFLYMLHVDKADYIIGLAGIVLAGFCAFCLHTM